MGAAAHDVAVPRIKYQGIDKSSAGYKLLAAMGWSEGQGLGAAGQGIKEHVKVKKKFDASGVGAVEAATKARDWTSGMVAYDRILAQISSVTTAVTAEAEVAQPAKQAKRFKKRKAAEPVDLDQDSKATTVTTTAAGSQAKAGDSQQSSDKAARKAAKRAKRAAKAAARGAQSSEQGAVDLAATKDRRKTDGKQHNQQEQGAADSQQNQSQQPAKAVPQHKVQQHGTNQPEAPKRRVARHVGRYHKHEKGKMVKGYSSTDLACILGVNPAEDQQRPSASSPEESDEDKAFVAVTQPKEEQKPSTPQPVDSFAWTAGSSEDDINSQPDVQAAQNAVSEGHWWSGMFKRAGHMGTMQEEAKAQETEQGQPPQVQIDGFSEEDQVKLYTMTQQGKSQGRQGLGTASQPKKVAGARWKGTKTVIADSGDELADVQEPQVASHAMVDANNPAPAVVSGSQQNAPAGAEPCQHGALQPDQIKWKKLATEVLKSADKPALSWRKLQKLVFQRTTLPDNDVCVEYFRTRIQASSRFVIQGNKVMLVQPSDL